MGSKDGAYYPLKDIREEKNKVRSRDYVANLGISYTLSPHWQLDMKYQFEGQKIVANDFHSNDSYFTRDLQNNYAVLDPATGALSFPIPWGGISDQTRQSIDAHQLRLQTGYHRNWGNTHDLALIAGGEFRNIVTTGDTSRQYGIGNAAAPSSPPTAFTLLIWEVPNPFPPLSGTTDSPTGS